MYLCLVAGIICADSMADLNIPADIAPAEQAPAVVPPTRTDDQILLSSKYVPIGKSNSVLYVQKSQRNPIFSIAMARKTPISSGPSQHHPRFLLSTFSSFGTPCALTHPQDCTTAPPSSDIVIEYVNTLGYPNTLRNVSIMSVNALYQPWRAILSMINMCLTGKTAVFDRPRHPVLQILWGRSLFTKLIIHHLRTKHNLHPRTGLPLHYSHKESVLNSLRFVGKDGREVFGMPIPDALLTDEITSAPYYSRYLEYVAEYQRCLDEEHGKAEKEDVTESPKAVKANKSKIAKQTKPSAPKASKVTTPLKPTPTTTEPSKKDQSKKA
ncbi:hypothetical protein Tco_1160749 [Tanacetum coccineum]